MKRGSIAINRSGAVIAFSREVEIGEPLGTIGIDVNERNVTWSDSSRQTRREDTSLVAELKASYKETRAKIASRTQKDRRIQRALLSRYGKREKDRTNQILHRISKRIVEHARESRFGIVMERLRGIRRLYRKGSGQGKAFRSRMNSWTFHEFQRQASTRRHGPVCPLPTSMPRTRPENARSVAPD